MKLVVEACVLLLTNKNHHWSNYISERETSNHQKAQQPNVLLKSPRDDWGYWAMFFGDHSRRIYRPWSETQQEIPDMLSIINDSALSKQERAWTKLKNGSRRQDFQLDCRTAEDMCFVQTLVSLLSPIKWWFLIFEHIKRKEETTAQDS